ncbi:MAG: glutamyl-tRNA ligase [Rickettsiaceae bacterium]|jgi:glutamyl-tRNA synthetase|nr:glutamyl-tRNA ligase [Rickettsiaceae bacterium]
MTICRFAPSPTGFLHVGNMRAAIINFFYAKKTGGQFLLRLDDTDTERTRDEYREMILQDMAWLGLEYSSLYKQSDRLEIYEEAKQKLINNGRLYECYESDAELNLQRKSQIASGIPPIYNRAALNLTAEQKENYRQQGIKPYYRFLLEDKIVSWDDKIKGKITYPGRSFSDPVLVRDNDVPTYTFCSVVDDIDLGITDIIRGEDHITNTAVQIQIFEALNGNIPHFSHLALIKASEGKISKREGGFDIKSLREASFEPLAIVNFLAQIGTSENVNIYDNIEKLIENFDLKKFSKSSTNYDIGELNLINQKLLKILPYEIAKKRLEEIGITGVSEFVWKNLQANLSFLSDIQEWLKICQEPFKYNHKAEEGDFLQIAKDCLPEDTGSADSWQNWLERIKQKSDRKGKELFTPIRLALTGKEHGPELKNILMLIDRKEILNRLS